MNPELYLLMAQVEGFEPPQDVNPLSVFKTDPFSRTWVNLHHSNGGSGRNRTSDTRIFSPLLYRLSYLGFCILFSCSLTQVIYYQRSAKKSTLFSNFFNFLNIMFMKCKSPAHHFIYLIDDHEGFRVNF